MKKYIKIATEYETMFNGFRVPVGACYCKNNNTRFVCMDYSGLKTGELMVYQQTETNKRWEKICVDCHNWKYKEVLAIIKKLGYIPKVKTFRNPYCRMYVPGLRKVNYNYLNTGAGVGTLVRQSHDNADHSGGGSVIHNTESYWNIYKDMERRCAINPLYE